MRRSFTFLLVAFLLLAACQSLPAPLKVRNRSVSYLPGVLHSAKVAPDAYFTEVLSVQGFTPTPALEP